MSKQIEQIRAEVERRKKVNLEEGETGWTCVDEDDEILHFINALPAEPVPSDVQEAADKYIGHPYEVAEGVEVSMRRDAYAAGMLAERERLMKEAPVAEVRGMGGGTDAPFFLDLTFRKMPRFELSGKPVRVIIEEIKEDGK